VTESAAQAVGALRDVRGVQGSFVLSAEGALLVRDIGALLNEELLAEIGPRATRLCETFSTETAPVTSCCLRFADLLLFLRPIPGAVLCVLSTLDVNMPALKMGVNLTARRLTAMLNTAGRPVPGP
jgi:predicted regulator of Ras-like GTPase activity (Roadblock/LC7/MglB family)